MDGVAKMACRTLDQTHFTSIEVIYSVPTTSISYQDNLISKCDIKREFVTKLLSLDHNTFSSRSKRNKLFECPLDLIFR